MIEAIPSCGEKVCDLVRLAAKITQQVIDDGIDPERVNWTRFFYEDGTAKVEWELTDGSRSSAG